MESVVVLLSGGMGSAVAAYRQKGDALLHPLYVDYGRASRKSQREAATAVAESAEAPLTTLELPHVIRIASATGRPVEDEDVALPGPPADTAGLMTTLLAVAAEYAAAVGAQAVISGISAPAHDDEAGNLSQERRIDPREFHHAFGAMLETALPAVRPVRLETPLIGLQPFEVVKLAQRLEMPLEQTWSCHQNAPPCGTCPGCRTRSAAFAAAGLTDPQLQTAER
ncbi:MAG: hypothetical protein GY778_27875 [bacterium]|nr:hypothetical protein [bacterium]